MHAQIWQALSSFDYRVAIDIAAVAFLVYRLLLMAQGTRALQIAIGLAVFFGVVLVSDWAGLNALNWLLRQALPLGPVAIVILFLPELRHALEEFGRPGFWGRSLGFASRDEVVDTIDAVVRAVSTLAIKRIGALIVFERENGLDDIVGNGTELNARVTSDLLSTIFYKGTPLHDGAVVIRQGLVAGAGCTLPLTASPKVDAAVHTRHKAAIGMSEESDAAVVVVSEETGTISLAVGGKLIRGLRDETLRERLMSLLQASPDAPSWPPKRIGDVASRLGDAIKTSRSRDARPEAGQKR